MLANAAREAGHEVRIVVPQVIQDAPSEVIGATAIVGQGFTRLHHVLEEWDPDVVHVQFAIAAFGIRTVALMHWLNTLRRDFQLAFVITLHEPTREFSLLPSVGGVIFRWFASHCDQVIVHTNVACKALVEEAGLAANKVRLMSQPKVQFHSPTSSPADLRARYGLDSARILLSFGFIHADKGLDDLVRALSILVDRRPSVLDNVRIVIAGAVRPRRGLFKAFEVRDRLYLARTLHRARRHALGEILVLTGYVPDGEVAAWFGMAEGIVLPYRRVDQSGVAWMARSLNVPILSSSTGGLAEQCSGSPWTFPPRAPSRLAETVADFLSATRAGLRDASGRGLTRNFAASSSGVLELYGQLVSERARR